MAQNEEVVGSKDAYGFTVTVEAMAYITQFTGGDGGGSQRFEEEAFPGETVRQVLKRMSAKLPRLDEVLWEGDQIGEHVEVIVNDTFLGERHSLDSEVHPGDTITLVGQFTGG